MHEVDQQAELGASDMSDRGKGAGKISDRHAGHEFERRL